MTFHSWNYPSLSLRRNLCCRKTLQVFWIASTFELNFLRNYKLDFSHLNTVDPFFRHRGALDMNSGWFTSLHLDFDSPKVPKNGFSMDGFSVFQLIFTLNCCPNFLLQSLCPLFRVFGRVIDFQSVIFSLRRRHDSPRMPNCRWYCSLFSFILMFTGLFPSTKVAIEFFLSFWVFFCLGNYQFCSSVGVLMDWKRLKRLYFWLISILNFVFFQKYQLLSSFKLSVYCFLKVMDCSIKMHWFSSLQWENDEPRKPERAFSLDMPRCSNSHFFSSTCFIIRSKSQSVASFHSIVKFVLYIIIGSLIGQKW